MKSLNLRQKKRLKEQKHRRRSRKDIEKEFIDTETVILRVSLSEAIIRNQKLILETLLDIRDHKS